MEELIASLTDRISHLEKLLHMCQQCHNLMRPCYKPLFAYGQAMSPCYVHPDQYREHIVEQRYYCRVCNPFEYMFADGVVPPPKQVKMEKNNENDDDISSLFE